MRFRQIFKIVFLSYVGYALAGKLGLQLIIPPGFSSVAWPAAGVALACLFIFKSKWALMGIFIASLSINLQVNQITFSTITFYGLIAPIGIAIGASLQAFFAYSLINKLKFENPTASNSKKTKQFILYAGLIGCLISPTFSVTLLYYLNSIPVGAILFTWSTWWIGDCVGVLLFTPMLLLIFSKKSTLSWKQKLISITPSVILFSIGVLLFFNSIKNSNDDIQLEINKNANHYIEQIKQNFNESVKRLNPYSAYFNASDQITRDEFNQFTKELLRNTSAFQGIGWTRIIDHSQRKQTELDVQQDGFPNFEFTQFSDNGLVRAEEREAYYPLLIIYPLEYNIQAFGLDLSTDQTRKHTLDLAKASGSPVATSPITLAQERGDKKAIIIYMPIYNLKSSEPVFIGFISGVLKTDHVANEVLSLSEKQNLAITIKDITDPNDEIWLIPPYQQPSNLPYIKQVEVLEFAGRNIQIEVFPNSEFKKDHKDWFSWFVLISSSLMTCLLQAFIFLTVRQNELVQQEVAAKTKALQSSTKYAEKANHAKSDFLANMSHELRTPMNAILGLIHLCLKTPLNHQQKNYLEKADLASQTLLELINHTLDYSKIEAGHLELESNEFSLLEVLNKLFAIFKISATQKNINFKITNDGTFPKKIIGDSLRLEQILINLCGNAVKFTKSGGVTLTIGATSINEHTQKITINITDTGIGIAPENQHKLFQPFLQADHSTSKDFGGTGLGLSISKQLIEAMQGTITLESEKNIGSTFTITFDALCPVNTKMIEFNELDLTENATLSTFKGSKQALKGIKILLVEDIEVNQMIAQEMLELLGASVEIAENGQVAVDMIVATMNYDIVLMDIQMPVMDGYSASEKIRETITREFLPILAMTASVLHNDIQKCLEAGMDDHISKPINEKNMVETILKYVNRL